jgi:hypothetical protein
LTTKCCRRGLQRFSSGASNGAERKQWEAVGWRSRLTIRAAGGWDRDARLRLRLRKYGVLALRGQMYCG